MHLFFLSLMMLKTHLNACRCICLSSIPLATAGRHLFRVVSPLNESVYASRQTDDARMILETTLIPPLDEHVSGTRDTLVVTCRPHCFQSEVL